MFRPSFFGSYGTSNRDFLKKIKSANFCVKTVGGIGDLEFVVMTTEITIRSFNKDSTIRCLGLHFSDCTVRSIEIL